MDFHCFLVVPLSPLNLVPGLCGFFLGSRTLGRGCVRSRDMG